MSVNGGKADEISEKTDIGAFDFKIFGEPPKCAAARWAKKFGLKNFRQLSSCLKRLEVGPIGRPLPPGGVPNCPAAVPGGHRRTRSDPHNIQLC